MVQPRLHWQLILAGQVTSDYQLSLIGLFNIAGALAYLKSKSELVSKFEIAQTVLVASQDGKTVLDEHQTKIVGDSLNIADRLLGIQSKKDIVAAIAYVESAIAAKGSALQQ